MHTIHKKVHGAAYTSHTEKGHVTVHILHRQLEKVYLIVHMYTGD